MESIDFQTAGPKPIYFAGTVNFGEIVTMTPDAKIYGRGNDNTFHGGVLHEWVEGDAGNDTLNGNGGDDTLYGDTFDNPWAVSWTAAGNDTLRGGDGNDNLHGQGGDDILNGGAGINFLWGDAGSDQFRFVDPNDHSVVKDFVLGTDRLQFDTSVAADFSALTLSNTDAGDALIVAGNVEITLTGVSSASLNSSHFDFGLFA